MGVLNTRLIFMVVLLSRVSHGIEDNVTNILSSSRSTFHEEMSRLPSTSVMLASANIEREISSVAELDILSTTRISSIQPITLTSSFQVSDVIENQITASGQTSTYSFIAETPTLLVTDFPTISTSQSNKEFSIFSVMYSNSQLLTTLDNVTIHASSTEDVRSSTFVDYDQETDHLKPTTTFAIEMATSFHTSSYNYPIPTHPSVTITGKKSQRQSRYFLIIKSDDCPRLKVHNVNHQLSKALSTLGVLNVSADIAKARCQTQLNVNITATAPLSAIQLLEDSKRHNLSIRVFNRTFKIVDIKKLGGFDANDDVPTTPTISAISKSELSAYVAVGACFGLVSVICAIVCAIRCLTRNHGNRVKAMRSNHTPLTPEDYTLTPIPRPTSLYVDYYRNSIAADVYSTTSAGSGASLSPTVDKGVVRSFDTSIIPLEDSALANFPDGIRRSSVGSAPCWNKPQVITNHGLVYCNAITDSRERLHPRHSNLGLIKAVGVSNPTYQRY